LTKGTLLCTATLGLALTVAPGCTLGPGSTVAPGSIDSISGMAPNQGTFIHMVCKRSEPDSVLLYIHGWNGDAEGTWQQFPLLACDDPRFARTDVISIDYPTYMSQKGFTIAETTSRIYKELVTTEMAPRAQFFC
jgi:hypothetical protein